MSNRELGIPPGGVRFGLASPLAVAAAAVAGIVSVGMWALGQMLELMEDD